MCVCACVCVRADWPRSAWPERGRSLVCAYRKISWLSFRRSWGGFQKTHPTQIHCRRYFTHTYSLHTHILTLSLTHTHTHIQNKILLLFFLFAYLTVFLPAGCDNLAGRAGWGCPVASAPGGHSTAARAGADRPEGGAKGGGGVPWQRDGGPEGAVQPWHGQPEKNHGAGHTGGWHYHLLVFESSGLTYRQKND